MITKIKEKNYNSSVCGIDRPQKLLWHGPTNFDKKKYRKVYDKIFNFCLKIIENYSEVLLTEGKI